MKTLLAAAWMLLASVTLSYSAEPHRPSPADVSYAVLDEGYPFKWCPRAPGYVPATQTCMDAMTEASLNFMVQVIKPLRGMPGSQSATDFCLSESQGASAITSLLNPVYEGNFGTYTGTWTEDWSGSDYSKPFYCARKARKFMLAYPLACAVAPEIARALPWLNLKIVNGKCIDDYREPAFVDLSMSSIQKLARNQGIINYDVQQPPLTAAQTTLLLATHSEHHKKSNWRCGVGVDNGNAVEEAHLALERSARNEVEHHFFVMKRFLGDVDPRWSTTEVCKIARKQDEAHHKWVDAVLAGDWAASRKAENDHQFYHLIMNLRDDRLIGRPDCGAADLSDCPTKTWRDLL
jgi:hypothetical protein